MTADDREARLRRLAEPADWAQHAPLVDDDEKMRLPPDLLRAISGPMQSAFDLAGEGMNASEAYEDCDANEVRMRGIWHALHYVQRRLSGWDKLPEDFFTDALGWERQTQGFKRDAQERDES